MHHFKGCVFIRLREPYFTDIKRSTHIHLIVTLLLTSFYYTVTTCSTFCLSVIVPHVCEIFPVYQINFKKLNVCFLVFITRFRLDNLQSPNFKVYRTYFDIFTSRSHVNLFIVEFKTAVKTYSALHNYTRYVKPVL